MGSSRLRLNLRGRPQGNDELQKSQKSRRKLELQKRDNADPQSAVALILDLPVQVRAIQTASIVRITQEGLGDPVPSFPAAPVAEGVLGLCPLQSVSKPEARATESDDSCHSSCR